MPTLNIKNAHVYELAKELSEATGRSMTSVIEIALERELLELSQRRQGLAQRLLDLASRTSSQLARLPSDPLDELYDPGTGLPR